MAMTPRFSMADDSGGEPSATTATTARDLAPMTSRLVCLDGELPVSKLHRCLLSSDSSNNYNIATVDITADLARLRSHNSCLATGPPVCPCNVPCLIVCTDNPLLVVAALSWLDDDVCTLSTLFLFLPAHAHLHAHEAMLGQRGCTHR
uniref:Uncharacterized protein n=1 Tax=Oryza sativa subsp. japonica TaxID=39947 RepID=Q5VRI2_ORYSJ|nr:hypothetical protein [Oryza sativa Japonica Group]